MPSNEHSEKDQCLSLEELQEANLGLLKDFDKLCKAHGIPYALCGGTALGAIRHKGFIPWDDDVDVMLMREDYERLLALKPHLGLEGRTLLSRKDETFARDYALFAHLGYARETDQNIAGDIPYLCIDIFPIDYIPDDERLFSRQVRDRWAIRQLMLTCASPFNTGTTLAKRWVRNLSRPFLNAYGKYRLAEKAEAVCTRYDNEPEHDIAIVAGEYGTKERWSKEGFLPLIEVPFEDGLFPVPHAYDEYLSAIYGDYMRIPPVEERRCHHARVYKIDPE